MNALQLSAFVIVKLLPYLIKYRMAFFKAALSVHRKYYPYFLILYFLLYTTVLSNIYVCVCVCVCVCVSVDKVLMISTKENYSIGNCLNSTLSCTMHSCQLS